MSEINVNHTFENDAHVYRRGLDKFEARTGLAPELVDTHGSGEEKQMFARMDAALTAAELKAQNAALEARLAKLESQPTLQARAPRIDGGGEADSRAWLASMLRGDMASARALGTTAQTAGTGQLGLTAGGNVPTDMERRIREKLYQASVIRQIATINTIDSKRTLLVENALPTAALVGEGAAVTLSDPTWSTVAVTPYKYGAGTQVSQEFIDDAIGNSGIGSVMDYISNRLALAIGRKMDSDFTIGAGTSGPQGIARTGGITTGINLGTQPQVIGNVTADNIIDTVHTVKPQYRQSARFRWLFHDAFLKVARKLKTTYGTVGTPTNTYTPATDYIWSPGTYGSTLTGGAPALLYGVPYSISEFVDDGSGSATENTVYAVIGDFTYFEIFDRTGMTAMVDPYSAMGSAATTMYVWARTDSRVTLADAFAAIRV